MALRRREEKRQQDLWVSTSEVAQSPGHVFYQRLNELLHEAKFDRFVEDSVAQFYASSGRPGVAPGVYFRMLFIGYFEGIDSQRGIAWRCQDSLSLRQFLGIKLTENVPDHSSMTRIRDRYTLEVTEEIFAFVLKLAAENRLISGTAVGVDSTLLEANAAMKSIVRKDTGEDWKDYLKRLMLEEGLIDENDEPSDEELVRFDRNRKGKKVSNQDWESPTDDDARITRMKDGRTRLGVKAEHTVDLETEVILSSTVMHSTQTDHQTLIESVGQAQLNLERAGVESTISEVAADKGYHTNQQITDSSELGLRTYIPEPKLKTNRRWTDKDEATQRAVLNNRRRTNGSKSKRLQRRRSEVVERSFAHICETGGARRSWLRGLEKMNKRYSMVVAAHNLGLILRSRFGSGKPRQSAALRCFFHVLKRIFQLLTSVWALRALFMPHSTKKTLPALA